MAEFKNEEIAVAPGEKLPGLSAFPRERQLVRDMISDKTDLFAKSLQSRFKEFCMYNNRLRFNPDISYKIIILIDSDDYAVFILEEKENKNGQ